MPFSVFQGQFLLRRLEVRPTVHSVCALFVKQRDTQMKSKRGLTRLSALFHYYGAAITWPYCTIFTVQARLQGVSWRVYRRLPRKQLSF